MKKMNKKQIIAIIVSIAVIAIAIGAFILTRPIKVANPFDELKTTNVVLFEYGEEFDFENEEHKQMFYDIAQFKELTDIGVMTLSEIDTKAEVTKVDKEEVMSLIEKENEETKGDEEKVDDSDKSEGVTEDLDENNLIKHKATLTITIDMNAENESNEKKIFVFEKEVEYVIIDTQMPVIEGKDNIEITQGDTLNLKELYSASDPIDGDLELTFTEYDLNKVGEQKITVSAKDANENEAKLELTLKVNEKAVVANRPSGGNTSKPSGNTSKPSGNTGGNSGNTGGSSGGSDGYRYYEKATCVLEEVSFTTGEYGEKRGSGKYTCYYHEHLYWVYASGREAYSVETEDGGRLEGGAVVGGGGVQVFSDFTLEGRTRVSNVAVKDFRDRYFPGAEITGTQY